MYYILGFAGFLIGICAVATIEEVGFFTKWKHERNYPAKDNDEEQNQLNYTPYEWRGIEYEQLN